MGKKREFIKAASAFTVSIGASMIVGSYTRLAIPADVRLIPKIFMVAGGYGIGGYVGEKAAGHVVEQIDIIADGIDNIKKIAKGDFTEEGLKFTVVPPGMDNVTDINSPDNK